MPKREASDPPHCPAQNQSRKNPSRAPSRLQPPPPASLSASLSSAPSRLRPPAPSSSCRPLPLSIELPLPLRHRTPSPASSPASTSSEAGIDLPHASIDLPKPASTSSSEFRLLPPRWHLAPPPRRDQRPRFPLGIYLLAGIGEGPRGSSPSTTPIGSSRRQQAGSSTSSLSAPPRRTPPLPAGSRPPTRSRLHHPDPPPTVPPFPLGISLLTRVGECGVPSDAFDLKLDAFFINNNGFSFSLPDNFGNSPVSVVVLANNKICGGIPSSIGKMARMLEQLVLLNAGLTSCGGAIISDFIPSVRSRKVTAAYLWPDQKKGGEYGSSRKPGSCQPSAAEAGGDDFEADFQEFSDQPFEMDVDETQFSFGFKSALPRERSAVRKSVEVDGPTLKSGKRKRKNEYRVNTEE